MSEPRLTAPDALHLYVEEQLARIRQINADTAKLYAEHRKLIIEDRKMRVDRWLAPVVAVSAAIGSFIASFAVVRALLHVAGLP